MEFIFEIRDKTGRMIYLTPERYKHILKHPEMHNSLEEIKETIAFPHKIIVCPIDENIRYYYRHYKNKKSKAKYLRLVIKYLNGRGFIITAHYTNKPK